MVNKVNKTLAIKLKEKGLTYAEIAREINCSIDWCKRNLQEFCKNKDRQILIINLANICKDRGYLIREDITKELGNIDKNETIKIIRSVENHLNLKVKSKHFKPDKKSNLYVVYNVLVNNEIVYVGSGRDGRQNHPLSGCSNVYEFNKLHFEGVILTVNTLEQFSNKEDALEYEQRLILELNPKYNKKNSRYFSSNTVLIRLSN